MLELWWAFAMVGAVAGFIAGLLGVGGGLIMVPAFASLFAWAGVAEAELMHLALGTSMASIVATSSASMMAHQAKGAVLWSVVWPMTPGIVLGAYLMTLLVSGLSGTLLSTLFFVFMVLIALHMLANKKPKPSRQLPSSPLLTLVGSVIGGVSSLFSIGGGTLSLPFLTWCNVALPKAIGTSAGLGLPIALAGSIGYMVNGFSAQPYTLGYVVWPVVAIISVAAFGFAKLGAHVAHSLPAIWVKRCFIVLLVVLAVRLLIQAWL